jgi:hypothetical protein
MFVFGTWDKHGPPLFFIGSDRPQPWDGMGKNREAFAERQRRISTYIFQYKKYGNIYMYIT